MAGIAGIGYSTPNLFQFLAEEDQQGDSLPSAGPSSGLAAIEALLAKQAASTDLPTQDSLDSLQTKITEAVYAALQDAEKSGKSVDLKQVVQDAVTDALQGGQDNPSAQDLLSMLQNSLNGGQDLLGYLFDSQQ
jgi:hypothetical protein